MVLLRLDGTVLAQGSLAPSSEIKMHLRIYRENPETMGVCHAHPVMSTSFAVAGIALERADLPRGDGELRHRTLRALRNARLAGRARFGRAVREKPLRRAVGKTTAWSPGGGRFTEAWHRMEAVEHYAQITFNACYVHGQGQTPEPGADRGDRGHPRSAGRSAGVLPEGFPDAVQSSGRRITEGCMRAFLPYDTVALDDADRRAGDRRSDASFPTTVEMLRLAELADIRDAIRSLKVRGAPAIGVAAAFGLYLAVKHSAAETFAAFDAELKAAKAPARLRAPHGGQPVLGAGPYGSRCA